MKRTWQKINSYMFKKDTKNRLFLLIQILWSGVLGAIAWGVIGRLFLPGMDWLLCFIGYPAIFVGFFGGILYLYNHEFA